MARGDLHSFVRGLCRRLGERGVGLPDAELLARWVASRDEAAFELLLHRHASLVLGVCRRMLDDPQDVEDAFQATFLLLLRKAAAVRKGESLGSWLYKVAYRVALRARGERVRPAASPEALETVCARPEEDHLWRDLRPVLDEEVRGLPEKYRITFILCHLQGKTNQEAADALGCPLGTVLSRLAWARERLRDRLTRRGLAVSSVVLLTVLSRNASPAAIPPALLQATFRTLTQPAAAGAMSAKTFLLAEGVRKAMFLTKVKVTTAVAALVCLLGLGTVAVSHRAEATPAPGYLGAAPADRDGEKARPAAKKRDWVLVPARQQGILEVIGREPRPGEKVTADRLITVGPVGKQKQYVRLVE
ncbi:MAG TPA: sigma-70 family RNA polymerase sigma factor, partial [Gemmataceae bacterium]|nr:sigma-70 family RNA polymerase sigma factor [Gemmataceae bacterium]